MRFRSVFALAAFLLTLSSLVQAQERPRLKLEKGDHICLVGNALAERMQYHNHWETELYERFPELDLTVRNLAISADEVVLRPRSLNFGTPDSHLQHSKADVVMLFFGFNESFAGEAGAEDFKTDLRKLIAQTRRKNYSGRGDARVVILSPIAVEKTDNPHIKDPTERNRLLEIYTAAMEEVAAGAEVPFVDMFHRSLAAFDAQQTQLTSNGIHLNDTGYGWFASELNHSLFGPRKPQAVNGKLHAEIADKNFHWFHRYRAVNGFSIYGQRGEAGSDGTYRNREVMERERQILDQMATIRDARIWRVARGEEVPDEVDDSSTLPFINPKSNVGTEFEDEKNSSKRGSFDYLPAEEQIKSFKLADGYVIELVASEEQFPDLINPVALNFDSRGRLWVSTMSSYPQWRPKTPMDDKLLILEDNDGDGKTDVCKTFCGGLHQPTGFEFGYGGVFIANQPELLFLKDTDGDDQVDVRQRRITGFDTADSHHGLAAFEWSNGGTLHFMEGIFKYTGIETHDGPMRSEEGAIWAYQPRKEEFRIHSSLRVTNPWGMAFDRWGQCFVTDGTRGTHFYLPPATGHLDFPSRHKGGRNDKKNPYPDMVKKIARPSPGCEVVSSSNFPQGVQGNYLVNNVIGLLGIMQYTLRDEGSGVGGDYTGNLIESTYGNFRPVDLQFGPDGALYIADWQNALIGHLQHNLRDPNRDQSHGRIWRIRYAANPLATPIDLTKISVVDLLQLLDQPTNRTPYRVRRELAARDSGAVLPAVAAWIKTMRSQPEPDQFQLLQALWVQQSHNAIDVDLLKTLLKSSDFHARAAATRVLCDCRDQVEKPLDLIAKQIHDPHPRVRLEAVRACSFFPTAAAAELTLQALDYDRDKYLDYVLEETMRQLDKF